MLSSLLRAMLRCWTTVNNAIEFLADDGVREEDREIMRTLKQSRPVLTLCGLLFCFQFVVMWQVGFFDEAARKQSQLKTVASGEELAGDRSSLPPP